MVGLTGWVIFEKEDWRLLSNANYILSFLSSELQWFLNSTCWSRNYEGHRWKERMLGDYGNDHGERWWWQMAPGRRGQEVDSF
jgi:hypothetical protein